MGLLYGSLVGLDDLVDHTVLEALLWGQPHVSLTQEVLADVLLRLLSALLVVLDHAL